MTDNNKIDADELLKKARALTGKIEEDKQKAAVVKKASTAATLGQAVEEIRTFNRTMSTLRAAYTNTKAAVGGFSNKYLRPVSAVGGSMWRGYKWLWNKTDKNAYDKKGKKILARAGRVILLWATVAACIQPLAIVSAPLYDAASYVVTEPVYDATRMALFYHNKETLFLNNTTEIDHAHSLHNVTGCRTIEKCDQDSSVYFRVKPSLMHSLWSAVAEHDLFIPGQVVAPITPGVNKCEVTSYGARWRITRWAQAYPYLLNVSCTPITIKDGFNTSAATATPSAHYPEKIPASVPGPAMK